MEPSIKRTRSNQEYVQIGRWQKFRDAIGFLVLMAGIVGGLGAIWKWQKKKEEDMHMKTTSELKQQIKSLSDALDRIYQSLEDQSVKLQNIFEHGDKSSDLGRELQSIKALLLRRDILFLKHDSSIFRQSTNPVGGFSMMEQVRPCAVSTENWLGFSVNHIKSGMTV